MICHGMLFFKKIWKEIQLQRDYRELERIAACPQVYFIAKDNQDDVCLREKIQNELGQWAMDMAARLRMLRH